MEIIHCTLSGLMPHLPKSTILLVVGLTHIICLATRRKIFSDSAVLLYPHTSLPCTVIGLIRLSNMCNIVCDGRVPHLRNLLFITPIALLALFDRDCWFLARIFWFSLLTDLITSPQLGYLFNVLIIEGYAVSILPRDMHFFISFLFHLPLLSI